MEGCVFCAMVAGKIPIAKVYEDDIVLAFLDIGPISDGHTLLIPRQHVAKIHECSPDLLTRVASRLGRVAGAVAGAMKADGYNILCNNGRAAGQVVDHLHFHIIPRRSGDGVLADWPAYKYEKGRIEELASKICSKLAGA